MNAARFIRVASRLSAAVLCTLAMVLFASCASAPLPEPSRADLDSGWQALAENRFQEAQVIFSRYERSQAAAEAARGSSLALFAMGKVKEAYDAAGRAILADPASPRSAAIRAFMWTSLPFGTEEAKKTPAFDAALTQEGLPVWSIRTSLIAQLESAERSTFDAGALSAMADKLGALRSWDIIGPYPDPSGGGIDIAYINETDPGHGPGDGSGLVTGPLVPDAWLSVKNCGPSGRIYPSGYLGGDSHSVHYALTSYAAQSAGDYWIILDAVPSGIVLWLDGAELLRSPEFRYGSEAAWIPVRLEKGEHRLLVKLCSGQSQASVRLCVKNAYAPEETKAALAYSASLPGMDIADADPLVAQLAASYGADKRYEDGFWLSYVLAFSGHPEAGLAACPGGSAVEQFAKYECARVSGDLAAGRAALMAVPAESGFAPREDYLITEASSRHDWEEAKRLCDAARETNGSRFALDWQAAVVDIALAQGDEALKVYEAFQKGKGAGYPYLAARVNYLGGLGVPAQALRAGMDCGSNRASAARLSFQSAFINEDFPSAVALAAKILAVDPWDGALAAQSLQARLMARLLNIDQFTSDLKAAVAAYPGQGGLYDIGFRTLASYKKSVEKSSGAPISAEQSRLLKDMGEKSLLRFPADFSVREELSSLNGQESPDSVYGNFDPTAVIAAFKAKGASYQADSVIVSDEDDRVFFPDGGIRFYRAYVKQVLSQRGVEAESTQVVDSPQWSRRFGIRRAFLVKADGRTRNADINGDRVSYPGLEPGDFLILQYVVDAQIAQQFRGDFWADAFLGGYAPIAERVLRIAYPSGSEPTVSLHGVAEGTVLKGERTGFMSGYKELSYAVKDLPAARLDLPYSDPRDRLPWLDVSTVKDWKRISKWYRDTAWGASRPTKAVADKARELVKDARSRDEAIRALYAFASSGIAYEDLSFQYSAQVPQGAQSVMEERFGDCKDKAALLIALLRSVGIEAAFGLSAPDYRGSADYLPSDRFSHVLVLLPEQGGWMALDPTGQTYTYPELPSVLYGTKVLPITAQGESALITLGPAAKAGTTWTFLLTAAKGSSPVSGTAVLRGDDAADARAALSSKDKALAAGVLESVISAWVPGLDVSTATVETAEGLGTSPSYSFKGSLKGILSESEKGLILKLPWACALPESLLFDARSDARASPLAVSESFFALPLKQTFVISLAKGSRPLRLPENAALAFREASARFSSRFEGERLVMEREICLPAMSVAPADIKEFRAFLEAVIAKQSECAVVDAQGGSL